MTIETLFERLGITRLVNRHDPYVPAETPPPNKLTPFVMWALKGMYPVLIIGAITSGIGGTLDVLAAFLLGLAIDAALQNGPNGLFSNNALMFVGMALFLLILRPLLFGLNTLMQNIILSPQALSQVHTRLHRWTLGQSVSFFDNDFAGRIAQKEMQTTRAVTETAVEVLNTIIFALVSVLSATLVLALLDWRISILLFIWIVAYLQLIRVFMPKIRARSKKRAAARANVTGVVVDTITNMRTVKLFAHNDYEDRAGIDAIEGFRHAALNAGYVSLVFRTLLMTLAGVLPVVLVGFSLYYWTQGGATAGQIAAVGAMSLRLSQMTGWVSFTLMGIYSKIGEIEDGMRTLSPAHDLIDAPDAGQLTVPKGEISFENVTFAYGRAAGGIFDLSLTIKPGEKVGIVGASGAGKSTLVSTLLRLYDTEKGQILIDGQDISGVTQESLRRNIGMVTQETSMFNRSARDNILYGRPDASQEDVVRAASQAEADEFIRGLEDFNNRSGYDAHLGERGVKLSGGQRQRIALARAFLKDAPILVLDEATSALDSEVEASIQDALKRVMDGKTVLAIAHRLSTIAQMDRIIVIDDGRVIEAGTHSELLAQSGLYAKFWARQSGGFIGIEEAAE